MSAPAGSKLAVDIGGTFTDIALLADEQLHTAKVLTTPSAPADAVLDGVAKLLASAAIPAEAIEVFIHGTTLPTNALIERRGAHTALLTTQGVRDAVEMAHENRFEQYDLYMRRPEPLVPRHLRIGIPERFAADGSVLLRLDEDAVRAAAATLQAADIESIAVGYLHAYHSPAHEVRTREILAECLPTVPVTLSSEVCPEIREYERFSTACANAYVMPLVKQYVTDLSQRLAAIGVGCEMLMMQSGGGLGTLSEALRFPVRLIESGPAGGALLAADIARDLNITNALSFDMGGTTAKLCAIKDGTARTSREFEVGREYRYLAGSGLPLRLPVIEMVEIGAGGSSIASLDALGQIAVGPRSAGAEPGPAAYSLGGDQPTVTDADLLLGRLLPSRFAGGDLVLNLPAAQSAIGTEIAQPAQMEPLAAAIGITEVVDENMANAARTHTAEQGFDVVNGTLIAFGGAAPLHAVAVARKLGIAEVIVPSNAGVGSAIGFLQAPASHESVRTRHVRVSDVKAAELRVLLGEMFDESHAVVAAATTSLATSAHDADGPGTSGPGTDGSSTAGPGTDGSAGATKTHLRALMRYRGQGHEITVDVDPTLLLSGPASPATDKPATDSSAAAAASPATDSAVQAHLHERFIDAYSAMYTRVIPGLEVEVLSWLMTVQTKVEHQAVAQPQQANKASEATGQAQVVDLTSGQATQFDVHDRSVLGPGAWLNGPALVVEDQTTTVIPVGCAAAVIGDGHLRVRLATVPLNQPTAAVPAETAPAETVPAETAPAETVPTETAPTAAVPASLDLTEIHLGIQWNRLISVVEEQARTLVKAAFSTSTREAGDLSAGVFDPAGRMLAQSVTGTPGHVNSMAYSVLHFLEKFPAHTMSPGDIYITNDPWKGTGHLFDIVVVTPTFRDGALVALFACTSHVVDIGGLGFTTDSNEIFHEGLYLPLMKFATDGEFDANVVAIIKANVRDPVQVIGDVHSLAACNETGARRLLEMMDEYQLLDLDKLGEHIINRSRQAMLNAVAELPQGTWHSSMRVDGIEKPIDLVAQLSVKEDGIEVDFAGTSDQSDWGINVPMAYTDAYTSFGVRCIVGPQVPNNTGSLEVVRVTAPEGSILNAPHPAAVAVRHVMGQMLPDTVFGALAQVVPERVPAEGTSALWFVLASGKWVPPRASADGASESGAGAASKPDTSAANTSEPGASGASSASSTERYILLSFHSGGAGARPKADGLSATAFPSGVRNMPIEVNEIGSPLVFWRKEFRPDTGGDGKYRGGLGQIIELENRQGFDFTISATYERVDFAARGRHGGGPGAKGRVTLDDGSVVNSKGRTTIAGNRRLIVEFPGGGGWGEPAERTDTAKEKDRRFGYTTS